MYPCIFPVGNTYNPFVTVLITHKRGERIREEEGQLFIWIDSSSEDRIRTRSSENEKKKQ